MKKFNEYNSKLLNESSFTIEEFCYDNDIEDPKTFIRILRQLCDFDDIEQADNSLLRKALVKYQQTLKESSDYIYKAKIGDKLYLQGNSQDGWDTTSDPDEAAIFESKTEPTQIINQMKKDGKISKNDKITVLSESISDFKGHLLLGTAVLGIGTLTAIDRNKAKLTADKLGIELAETEYGPHKAAGLVGPIYEYKYGMKGPMNIDSLCEYLKNHTDYDEITYEDEGDNYVINYTDNYAIHQTAANATVTKHRTSKGNLNLPKEYFDVSFVLDESKTALFDCLLEEGKLSRSIKLNEGLFGTNHPTLREFFNIENFHCSSKTQFCIFDGDKEEPDATLVVYGYDIIEGEEEVQPYLDKRIEFINFDALDKRVDICLITQMKESTINEARVFSHSSGFGLSGHYDYVAPKKEPLYIATETNEDDGELYFDERGCTTEFKTDAKKFTSEEEALEFAKNNVIFGEPGTKLIEKRIELPNLYPVKKDEIIDLIERSSRLIHTATDSKTIQLYIYSNGSDRPEALAEVEITSVGYILHGTEGYDYQGNSLKEFQDDLKDVVFHFDATTSKRFGENVMYNNKAIMKKLNEEASERNIRYVIRGIFECNGKEKIFYYNKSLDNWSEYLVNPDPTQLANATLFKNVPKDETLEAASDAANNRKRCAVRFEDPEYELVEIIILELLKGRYGFSAVSQRSWPNGKRESLSDSVIQKEENTMKKLFENNNLFDYVLNESSSSLKENVSSLEWLLDKAYVSEYRMVGKNSAEVRVRHTPELLTSDSMAARFAEDIPDGYKLEVDYLGEDPILGRNFDIYEVQLLKD